MRCAADNTCQCAVLHGDRVNRKHTCHTIAHQLTLIRTSSEHPGSASVEQRVDPTRDLIAILATEALFIVIIPILLVLRNNGLSSKAMALITSDCGATRSLGIKWP